jgi:glycosyltransferase involved in cell wall biosynthesis
MKKLYGFGDNKIAFRPFVRSTPCVSHKVIDGLDEDIIEKPFILSMGSNGRDYETFFKAIADSGITAVVVSRPYNVYNMSIPDNVVLLSGIKLDDCDYLSSKCLFTVFTFDGTEPSCGQISIVTSLMLGKPVICTDIDGVHDYIVNDYNGLLVNIFNADDLREKILDLYNNCDLYSKLSDGAKLWANDIGSEEAARTLLDKTISKLVCQ